MRRINVKKYKVSIRTRSNLTRDIYTHASSSAKAIMYVAREYWNDGIRSLIVVPVPTVEGR